MKKNILVLLLAIFSVQIADAQRVKFGIKAGLNLSEFSIEKQKTDTYLGTYDYNGNTYIMQEREFKKRPFLGYYIGALTEIALDDDLFIETGLTFTQQGTNLESMKVNGIRYINFFPQEIERNSTSLSLTDSYIKMSMLNIPLWVKIPVSKNRKLISKVGANVGCSLFVKEKIGDITYDLEGGDFDFRAGIGVEYVFVSGIFIDWNLTYGLVNMNTYPKVKNKMAIQIGLGYKF